MMLRSIPNVPSCSEPVVIYLCVKHIREQAFQEASKVVGIVQECAFELKQNYQGEVPSKIHSSMPVISIMVSDFYWASLTEVIL